MTFQQLLILADQDGAVDMTAAAIARRTTIPLDIITRGIATLMEPDPESRTPDEGGRRLVPLADGRSWGWRIVNYVKYRQIKREEDRREYHREYWHKRKLKGSTSTQQTQPNQPIAEAEAEAEAEEIAPSELADAPQSAAPPSSPGSKTPRKTIVSAPQPFDGTNAESLNGRAVVPLASGWDLPTPWGEDAEALGFKPADVLREAERFRQYWVSGKGAGTRRNVKGWRQCWSNWLAKAAERAQR